MKLDTVKLDAFLILSFIQLRIFSFLVKKGHEIIKTDEKTKDVNATAHLPVAVKNSSL